MSDNLLREQSWFSRCASRLKLATKRDVLRSEARIIAAFSRPRVQFLFSFDLPRTKERKPTMPVEIKITNEQKVPVSLKPVTDTGKPAKLDGKPSWSVVSGDSTIKVADDGLSADLISSDTPGDTAILIEADADIGDGVETISDTIKLTVLGASAKNLGVSVGTPVAKDETAPV